MPAPRAAPAEVPLPSSRDDAEMLQRTLLLAQRAADDAVNEAQARARQLLEESEAKAQSLVSDAEATARRIAEGERRRLEAEILDLSARREQLRADADALEEYASGYRDRIRAAIESDLATSAARSRRRSSVPSCTTSSCHPNATPRRLLRSTTTLEPEPEGAGPDDRRRRGHVRLGPRHAPSVGSVEPAGSGSGAERIARRRGVRRRVAGRRATASRARCGVAAAGARAGGRRRPPHRRRSRRGFVVRRRLGARRAGLGGSRPVGARHRRSHEAFSTDVPVEATASTPTRSTTTPSSRRLREAVRDDAPLGPRDEDQAHVLRGQRPTRTAAGSAGVASRDARR